MHAPIIQFITQCLNSEVKLRWNHETECEKEVHTRELQLGNACCLLPAVAVARGPYRSRRGGRAGGHRCKPVRGCGMLAEPGAEVPCRAGVRAQPHGAPAASGKRAPAQRPDKASTRRSRGSQRGRVEARRVAEARSSGGRRQRGAAAREGAGWAVELAACRVPQVERVDEGDKRTAGLRFDCWAVICSV